MLHPQGTHTRDNHVDSNTCPVVKLVEDIVFLLNTYLFHQNNHSQRIFLLCTGFVENAIAKLIDGEAQRGITGSFKLILEYIV